MADWDDDDFDPDAGFAKATATDKWEGEDEEEDVKDDWAASDDEEGEKKKDDAATPDSGTGAFQVKKKKNTLEQALKKKAEKRKTEQKEEEVELTPEEQIAEKLRQQKMVEEADFEIAKDAFGISGDDRTLDSMLPSTEEDFAEFGNLLKDKLSKLESSEHYFGLLDDVFQACCVCLDAEQVKKIGSSLTAIGNEKSKAQRQATKGKKAKSKKAVLAGSGKSGKKDNFDDFGYDGGNDLDDFM